MIPEVNRDWPPVTTMGAIMLIGEEAEGREPIMPNNVPDWIDPTDWEPWPVLSIGGGELHIIAVKSYRKGALKRLIAGAQQHGLTPVIVQPVGMIMPSLLDRWGWTMTRNGVREEWRP